MPQILEFLELAVSAAFVVLVAFALVRVIAEADKHLRVSRAEASMVEAQARRSWVEVERLHADVELVSASANGHLPVARRLLTGGTIANQQLALIAQDIRTRLPVQPVPQTFTYAPHSSRVDAPTRVDLDDDDSPSVQVVARTPTDFWQLWQAGEMPEKGFLMGHNLTDGSPVYADWKNLYSALIGGTSGSGKSTLVRNILAQSAIQGGRFVVLDRHLDAGEESLGYSLQPLRSRMMCDVSATDKDMLQAIGMVRHIGERRLAGEDKDKSPVILVVDETTAMLQRSAIATPLRDLLEEIAQETRKVGVYAMCIGQNFHGEIMKTTVRDSFVSYLSCRTRPNVARVMSGDTEFGKLAGGLKVGECVWMDTSGDLISLAVPNTTQKHLEQVARQIGAFTPVEVDFQGASGVLHGYGSEAVFNDTESASEVCEEPPKSTETDAIKLHMVRDFVSDGMSNTAIIKKVWGVSGGKAFQNANAELKQIRASIAKEQR